MNNVVNETLDMVFDTLAYRITHIKSISDSFTETELNDVLKLLEDTEYAIHNIILRNEIKEINEYLYTICEDGNGHIQLKADKK